MSVHSAMRVRYSDRHTRGVIKVPSSLNSENSAKCPLELSWVHILLPGYPLTNTRRVPGYPFIRCRIFSALNQDQDCQNRPTRSQDMSKFLHQSLWLTSFRALLWLFSHVFTPLAPQLNCSRPLWMLLSAQVEAIGVKCVRNGLN